MKKESPFVLDKIPCDLFMKPCGLPNEKVDQENVISLVSCVFKYVYDYRQKIKTVFIKEAKSWSLYSWNLLFRGL